MTKTEALTLAMEALEPHKSTVLRWYTKEDQAIDAIREALAAPQEQDDMTIAYMSGVHAGKKAAPESDTIAALRSQLAYADKCYKDLEASIAAPKGEPVAWLLNVGITPIVYLEKPDNHKICTPLYAHPSPAPLSKEETDLICNPIKHFLEIKDQEPRTPLFDNEKELFIIMARYGLNFVVGEDMDRLLRYGRDCMKHARTVDALKQPAPLSECHHRPLCEECHIKGTP